MKSTKCIWINPVERISHQGRHKQVYTIKTGNSLIPTVSMKKVKEDNTPSVYQFPHNPNKNRLETGLNRLVLNPFYNLDPGTIQLEYGLSTKWVPFLDNIARQENIKEQTLFEIKHGVDPDFYTDEVKYTMLNMPHDLSEWGRKTFLQDLKLTLYPRPNKLEDTTPRQELLMKMAYVVPAIAKTKNEANPAYHDWFISEEHEAEQEKAKKKEIYEEAVYNLYKLKMEYGAFRTYQIGIVLRDNSSKNIMKGKVSSSSVNNILSDFISKNDQHQLRNINEFMKLVKLLETREGIQKLDIMYLVQQAINTNVLAFRDQQYIWHSKAGTPDVYNLGTSYDALINFFYKEYATYNSDSNITNWYHDLFNEVKQKGIQFE